MDGFGAAAGRFPPRPGRGCGTIPAANGHREGPRGARGGGAFAEPSAPAQVVAALYPRWRCLQIAPATEHKRRGPVTRTTTGGADPPGPRRAEERPDSGCPGQLTRERPFGGRFRSGGRRLPPGRPGRRSRGESRSERIGKGRARGGRAGPVSARPNAPRSAPRPRGGEAAEQSGRVLAGRRSATRPDRRYGASRLRRHHPVASTGATKIGPNPLLPIAIRSRLPASPAGPGGPTGRAGEARPYGCCRK